MRNYLLFFLLFIFCCKSSNELGNGYYLTSDFESTDIGYPYGSVIYKSKKKNVFSDIVVYSDILAVRHNDNYIIVKQKPNLKNIQKEYADDINFYSISSLDRKRDSFKVLNKLYDSVELNHIIKQKSIEVTFNRFIKTDTFFSTMFKNNINYYIIDKSSKKISSPLNEKDFNLYIKRSKIDLQF